MQRKASSHGKLSPEAAKSILTDSLSYRRDEIDKVTMVENKELYGGVNTCPERTYGFGVYADVYSGVGRTESVRMDFCVDDDTGRVTANDANARRYMTISQPNR
jgi:hypothetical protein